MAPKEENNMVKVNITGLYNLVEKKVAVEPRFILNEAKAWYEGIKLEGSKHVLLFYEDENGERVEKRCPQINNIELRRYEVRDIPEMVNIWNEVVKEGNAFPQEDLLTEEKGKIFFERQSYCGVAVNKDTGKILGMYILHPNNVGRCGHIANASFAVSSESRGLHIGEKMVRDCIQQAHREQFKILQFNAVVESNMHAIHLYERIGFKQLGVIPNGFKVDEGKYENICVYYIEV